MPEDRWLIAFHFPDYTTADGPYVACRDMIFEIGVSASSYRIDLDGETYVVVVGDGELTGGLRSRFEQACQAGRPAGLPQEYAEILFERRARNKSKTL